MYARAPAIPGRGRQFTVAAVAAATALALVFFMISSVTSAAWTDTTDNTDNSWATGEVSLTDDDLGVAMFSVTNMVPGTTVDNSITVENESSVPLDVKLYAANFANTNSLGGQLNLKVGTTAGGSQVYDGTLAGFNTTHTGYATGTAVIELAPDATQTYFFEVQLSTTAPDSVQGSNAQIDFVWEGHTQ